VVDQKETGDFVASIVSVGLCDELRSFPAGSMVCPDDQMADLISSPVVQVADVLVSLLGGRRNPLTVVASRRKLVNGSL